MGVEAQRLQEQMVALVRAFGLHQPDQTPCGQPVAVSEAHALMELTRAEVLCQKELAARLRLEKSTVSRLVKALEQRRWVVRERAPEDARMVHLRLSVEGRRVAEQLERARSATFARILACVPEVDREPIVRALDVLVQAIDASR